MLANEATPHPSPSQGLTLTHKFLYLVAQPFQAVRKSLAQVENLCHQKLVESTTSPLVGNDKPRRGEGVFAAIGFADCARPR